MIKCPLKLGRFSKSPSGHLLNLPRFTGHLITNIPQSMRLLIIRRQKIVMMPKTCLTSQFLTLSLARLLRKGKHAILRKNGSIITALVHSNIPRSPWDMLWKQSAHMYLITTCPLRHIRIPRFSLHRHIFRQCL